MNHSHKPKVSVIIPTFNNARYLQESLTSIFNQTMPDFELLLFDDASTDDTPELLQGIKDPRLFVHRTEYNQGPGKCRNLGFQIARGKFIALMDSDDISVENRLALQVDYMEKNPSITVCGGKLELFGSAHGYYTYPEHHEDLKAKSLFHNPMGNPVVMLKGDYVRQHNIKFREDMTSCSDYDLWMRLAHCYEDCRFASIQAVLGKYRVHDTNITQTKSPKWLMTDLSVRLPYFTNLCGDVSPAEIDVYQLILRQKCAANKEELLYIKQLLLKMDLANKNKAIYAKEVFSFWLTHKFMEICLASLHLGPWVVNQLRTHENFDLLNLRSQEITMLLNASAKEAKRHESVAL